MNVLPFKFPLLRIPEPNQEGQKWPDYLHVHCDDESFVVGDRKQIIGRFFVGHLIFDALGRSWRIEDLTDLGFRERPLVGRLLGHVFRLHDIRYELSPELGLPFSAIRDKVADVILADPELYARGAQAIEVYDYSKTNEELFAEFLTQVRNSVRPLELIAAVHFHEWV